MNFFIITDGGQALPLERCAIVASRQSSLSEDQVRESWSRSAPLTVISDTVLLATDCQDGDILLESPAIVGEGNE